MFIHTIAFKIEKELQLMLSQKLYLYGELHRKEVTYYIIHTIFIFFSCGRRDENRNENHIHIIFSSVVMFVIEVITMSCSLLFDIVFKSLKEQQLLFANAFKSVKSVNYCCRNSWKSDNYMGSNTEKKP